jgi:tryptophan synthase beta chain
VEGILPALESAHAIAEVRKRGAQLGKGAIAIVSLSGRGDKDAPQVRDILKAREGKSDA